MQTFEHRGVTIAYERRGDGPTILFVHNGGTSSTIWRHQLDALEDGHDVIAIDLPGFGCSPRPAPGIDHRQQVELLVELIDALGLAPVAIVGNCMGSNLAAAVAVERPDLVSALVLVNPLTEATFSAGITGPLHRMQRWLPAPTRLLRDISRRLVPPRVAASMTVRTQVGTRGRARGVHRDEALLACNRRRDQLPALIDVLDDMSAYGVLDREAAHLRSIPLCTIWGAQNKVLSPKVGRRLNAQLQPERAEVLEGCGHLAMLEDPDRVTTIIEEFTTTHALAATAG